MCTTNVCVCVARACTLSAKRIVVCVLSFVLLWPWSRDECRANLRPRLADPPLHRSSFSAIQRVSVLHPHPRVDDSSGVTSGTWAVSSWATPNRVASLPARRARQMFFVADYDAVCAIMTTSLFLSPRHRFLSILRYFLSVPRTPALSARWLDFFLSLLLSLFLSRAAIFSLPTRTNFALASAVGYDVVSDTRRGE